jgi:hypothetical protein
VHTGIQEEVEVKLEYFQWQDALKTRLMVVVEKESKRLVITKPRFNSAPAQPLCRLLASFHVESSK